MIKIHNTIEQLTSFSPHIAESIKNLATKIGHNHKSLTDLDIKEMLASTNTFIFVAWDVEKKHIIGMVTLLVFRIPYVKKASIEDLVVDESYRGKGIGGSLMQKAVEEAKKKKVAYIDFTSRPRREASNALYEKLGFKKRETNVYRFITDYAEF